MDRCWIYEFQLLLLVAVSIIVKESMVEVMVFHPLSEEVLIEFVFLINNHKLYILSSLFKVIIFAKLILVKGL